MEPYEIVDKMFNNDAFSKWLGIERLQDGVGVSSLQMRVREEMLNGFGIAHGGITYSLADSALAFASNSHGQKSVSVETNISHLKQVKAGDLLRTDVKEVSLSNKIALYTIDIRNQQNELVAAFKGTVYRTSKHWE